MKALATIALASAAVCNWDLELLMVHDASESQVALIQKLGGGATTLIERIDGIFASVRTAITAFVDKPSPFRGIGNGRGYEASRDYCYKRVSPFTVHPQNLIIGYRNLALQCGAGGDNPENVYEGMFYTALDEALDYPDRNSDDNSGTSEGGGVSDSPVRAMIVVTDDVPHYAGDVQDGIDMWQGTGPYAGDDMPHFGDYEFINSPNFFAENYPAIYGGEALNGEKYARFLSLHDPTSEEYKALLKLLGPDQYPTPGTYSDLSVDTDEDTQLPTSSCATVEYPRVDLVGQALQSKGIIPIVLVTSPDVVSTESENVCKSRGYLVTPKTDQETRHKDFLKCLTGIYAMDLVQTMGIEQAKVLIYEPNSLDSFVETVGAALTALTDELDCVVPVAPTSNKVLPWAAAGVVAVGLLACLVPTALAPPKGEIPEPTQISTVGSSSVSIDEDDDSCSWTNYI